MSLLPCVQQIAFTHFSTIQGILYAIIMENDQTQVAHRVVTTCHVNKNIHP
jgi:hypothetical protein